MESRDRSKFEHMREVVGNPELALEDEIRVIQDELLDRERRTVNREEALALIEERKKGKVLETVTGASEPLLDHQRGWERKMDEFNEKFFGPNGLGLNGDTSDSKEGPTPPNKS